MIPLCIAGILIAFGTLTYAVLCIIDILTYRPPKPDFTHWEDSGDCPNCEKGNLYSNWHGDNYLEYKCDSCEYSLFYEKGKDGRWRVCEPCQFV